MSTVTDPLTQGINALTAYCNQIDGESDTNLSDAVYSLAQGYGQGGDSVNYLNYAKRLYNLFNSATNLPPTIEFTPQLASGNNNADFMGGASAEDGGLIDLTIHLTQTTSFSFYRLLFNASSVKTLTLTGNLNLCTSYMNAFQNMTRLETFDADLDFSGCTASNTCVLNSANGGNTTLTSMRFVANTCSYSLNLKGFTALNDASLVSAANCLVAGVSSQSLVLHSTPKARCSSIMGTVTDGTFTADESGDTTLADFITNTKGWTLS